jgi:glyoxylase-like metal-dependent hydrolase (beta-lactamase superfamily II)
LLLLTRSIYALEPLHNYCQGERLHIKKIGKNVFMIDLQTGGFKNLICSYLITGKKPFLVESGPANSVPNLLYGLRELDVKLEDIEYVAVTHVHLDHGGGAGTLLKHLPNTKVMVHPRGMPTLSLQSGFGRHRKRFSALSAKSLASLSQSQKSG